MPIDFDPQVRHSEPTSDAMRIGSALVLVSMIVLSGCSSVNSETQRTSPNSGSQQASAPTRESVAPSTESIQLARCVSPIEPFTVKVWHILPDGNAGGTFNAFVSEFNATHPSIKIESEKVGNFDTLIKRLQDQPKDTWPDIIVSATSGLKRLADSGALIAPGECRAGDVLKASLLPSIAAAYSISGKLQAMPYGVSTPVLLFDENKMRAAGLDPNHPPKTADELFAASKQIVDSGASAFGLVVYDWYSNFVVNQWAAQRGDLVATPDNGRDGQDIVVDYNTAANRAAMQWISDVISKGGGAWIGGESKGTEDLVRLIQHSDGATMSIHTSGSIGDILAVVGKGDLKDVALGVGPMPGPGVGGLVGGNGIWLIDHGSAQRAGAAWDVIQWLYEPEHLARFDVATGYIPPSEAVASTPAIVAAWNLHPQLKVGYDQLRAMPATDAAAGALFGASEIDSVFWDLTNSVVDRHTDLAGALTAASDNANRLIAAYRNQGAHS